MNNLSILLIFVLSNIITYLLGKEFWNRSNYTDESIKETADKKLNEIGWVLIDHGSNVYSDSTFDEFYLYRHKDGRRVVIYMEEFDSFIKMRPYDNNLEFRPRILNNYEFDLFGIKRWELREKRRLRRIDIL